MITIVHWTFLTGSYHCQKALAKLIASTGERHFRTMQLPPKVISILEERYGLEHLVYEGATLDVAIHRRQLVTEITNEQEYIKRLVGSTVEIKALVEELMVSESWFFRDQQPYYWLKHWVTQEWPKLKSEHGGILRILSAPCAAGRG